MQLFRIKQYPYPYKLPPHIQNSVKTIEGSQRRMQKDKTTYRSACCFIPQCILSEIYGHCLAVINNCFICFVNGVCT